jgi:thiol-disulfide isomerase/thioredoxin
MKRIAPVASIVTAILLFFTANATAVIHVGDEAKLKFNTVDGKQIDLEKLHGKVVVVDFWATWLPSTASTRTRAFNS